MGGAHQWRQLKSIGKCWLLGGQRAGRCPAPKLTSRWQVYDHLDGCGPGPPDQGSRSESYAGPGLSSGQQPGRQGL